VDIAFVIIVDFARYLPQLSQRRHQNHGAKQ
jgi:hypothetical protein